MHFYQVLTYLSFINFVQIFFPWKMIYEGKSPLPMHSWLIERKMISKYHAVILQQKIYIRLCFSLNLPWFYHDAETKLNLMQSKRSEYDNIEHFAQSKIRELIDISKNIFQDNSYLITTVLSAISFIYEQLFTQVSKARTLRSQTTNDSVRKSQTGPSTHWA